MGLSVPAVTADWWILPLYTAHLIGHPDRMPANHSFVSLGCRVQLLNCWPPHPITNFMHTKHLWHQDLPVLVQDKAIHVVEVGFLWILINAKRRY